MTTGNFLLDLAAALAALAAGVAAVVYLVFRPLRWGWRMFRRVSRFLDDWFGVEASPGVERRPGFPERLAAVETETSAVKAIVSNGLSHRVEDIQQRVIRVEDSMAAHLTQHTDP
ncbi:hypothetical protein [Nonomuraea sp. 10N515B]|uniref:hypothetical protein n=1 Tax=Nonomuraea sp. 10N515B TaxID=3457422 RepID=UPI003FCC997E